MINIYDRLLFIHKKSSIITTWINLADTTLSEISQTQKVKYCMMISYVESKKAKLIEQEHSSSCQELEVGENGEMMVKGYRLSVTSKFWGSNVQHGD